VTSPHDGFGRLVVALRWPIIAVWVVAAVLATMALPTIEESQNGALGDLVPNDSPALDAELRSASAFGFPVLSRTLLVQRNPDGLSSAAQAATLERAVALNRHALPGFGGVGGAIPVLNTVALPPFTRERGTTAVTSLFFGLGASPGGQLAVAHRLERRAAASDPESYTGVTGAIAARAAQSRLISDALPWVELCTILLVALAIGLHYRALLAPLVTIAAIAITYLITVRAVAWIGEKAGVSVPSEVQPVIVVLLFGILTDYAIFFLSRFRLRLAQGATPRESARSAAGDLVGTIVAAGLTVAAASAALLVADLGFFQTFGPGLALSVLIGLVVAVTFIPAALAILGDRVFWPSRPGRDVPRERAAEERPEQAVPRPVRSRALRLASRRPVATAIGTGLLLLAAASGLLRLDVGQTLIRGLPADAEARVAYHQAARGFAPGVLAPTVVMVEAPGITARRTELRRLQDGISALPGVALVVGPAQQRTGANLGAVFARTRDAVRYLIVFNADPLGAGGIRRLERLRSRLPDLTANAGLAGVTTSIAGDTAIAEETVRLTSDDLGRVAPVALLVVFLVLAAFLRALVAPLYLVAASVLALAASLGITVYVFQDLLGHRELTYYVPFVAAVMLVALGSDYNVFLAGRIWQEARTRPLREAVAVGGSRAAAAITVAGVVLALSFALLAIVPVRPFRELAFAMSCGLLIDAFIVRTLFVPALITIVGPVSAWPSRRLRAHPSLTPEPDPRQPVPAPRPHAPAATAAARPLAPGAPAVAAPAGPAARPVAAAVVGIALLSGALRARRGRAGSRNA
jgi:putative drug exporter of the RND superfamily